MANTWITKKRVICARRGWKGVRGRAGYEVELVDSERMVKVKTSGPLNWSKRNVF